MKIHKEKFWQQGVIKSMKKTSPITNRGTTKLGPNLEKERTCYKCGKNKVYKMRMSRQKKKKERIK
jgi:hypothetical protein